MQQPHALLHSLLYSKMYHTAHREDRPPKSRSHFSPGANDAPVLGCRRIIRAQKAAPEGAPRKNRAEK